MSSYNIEESMEQLVILIISIIKETATVFITWLVNCRLLKWI